MSVSSTPPFQAKFLMPQYWAIWLGVLLLWSLAHLPWRAQLCIGNWLGEMFWRLAKKRRLDTQINLALCFPELSEAERIEMSIDVFRNGMIGFFESLSAWYTPKRFNDKVSISGLEHLLEAQKRGKGVLLLGGHYTTLDLGGYLSSLFFSAHVVYRPQNNPLFEWLITRARANMFEQQIDHDDMRGLISALKSGQIVWYSPDQDYGLKQGVMAPFFGIPAATVTAPRRLVKINNSAILAFHSYRSNDIEPHYQLTITPELLNYPSDDPVLDATRVNALFEELIRITPTQWMWFHRRFKSQPEGKSSLYMIRKPNP
ncbi:MAG: LpxL/LpxP family Kdo(2)-lipid IV(A) lauroyl/palmitoleoyl acyltransferase [Aquirhabdus sp.]